MKEIDWSKAPEGFPVWIEDLSENFNESGWHRDDGDRYTGQDGSFWTKPGDGYYKAHLPHAWTGEGLPPVGAMCEVEWCEEWHQCEVIAHLEQRCGPVAAFTVMLSDGLKSLDALVAECFQPLRTPEQIAAEERDKAIRALLAAFDSGIEADPAQNTRSGIEAIYDAGYRKQD